jgi:uncharacterized membrane protein YkoI
MKRYVVTLLAAAGLLAGCNPSVESASRSFNELPPAVQKTARAQAPNAEIDAVSHDRRDGRDLYTVEFRRDGGNAKVVIAEDGQLVSSDFANTAGTLQRALTPTGAAGTPLSALPLAAQKTIQREAPDAQVADISRHENNGRVIYEVEFADKGKNPTMRVAEDGTLVQTLQK